MSEGVMNCDFSSIVALSSVREVFPSSGIKDILVCLNRIVVRARPGLVVNS